MRWLKSLFGSEKSPLLDPPEEITGDTARVEPFSYVSSGLKAWEAGDLERAEGLLRQGVQAYRLAEPDGVDFALGRLGAYLLELERVEEAEEVLDEAITRGTDIPAIWADYLDIMTGRRDVDGLFDTAMRWHESARGDERPWDMLLARARNADRAGNSEFAETVANRVVDSAREVGDQQASWAAVGVLGHILERSGQLDRALELWTEAFNEGSDDSTTANRLSMHRERARDYKDAIAIIEEALDRHLPANTEEQLRKRLERCRARAEGRQRRDVQAYSVRVGEDTLQSVFQSRISPVIRTAHIQDSKARCFGVSKSVGTVVDVSLTDGSEVGRYTDLPAFGAIRFSRDGFGLGTVQAGRVGSAVTTLTFLAPDLTQVATSRVPDAVSEFVDASGTWYVGCRDGYIYAFRQTGELLWRWEVPGSRNHDGDTYSRPCPYYLSSDGERVVTSSMGHVYCVNSEGATIWHFQLPNDDATSMTTSIPLSDVMKSDEVGAGPSKPDTVEEGVPTLEFSITVPGIEPTVSRLTANSESVLVGSSDGRILVLSMAGQLRSVHELGGSWAGPVMDIDETPVAAYSHGSLFRWERDGLHHVTDVAGPPDGVGVWSDGLYLWKRKRLDVLDWSGQEVWSAEFSKNINSAVVQRGRLICAAGVLAAFALPGGAK